MDIEFDLETNEAHLRNARKISTGSAFTKAYRRSYEVSIFYFEAIKKDLQEALEYADSSVLDEEYGILMFTYIKTDINGVKSVHEDELHCMKKPEGSPVKHPFAKMLDAKFKANNLRSSIDGISFDRSGLLWNFTREQKDLAELSKRLCRRYFSFEKGSFYLKGQAPMTFDE